MRWKQLGAGPPSTVGDDGRKKVDADHKFISN